MTETEILSNESHSEWLRAALYAALRCDPITAANEAEFLASVLQQRALLQAQESEAVSARRR